mgnify:CR=1 FL=1
MATLTSLIDHLEQSGSRQEARKILSPHRGLPGLSQAYFERIATHFSSNPARAYSLADHWRLVASLGDDPSYAYRAKGVADRGRGNWLASARSFMKAGELAKTAGHRYSFQAGAVDALARAAKMAEAEQLAEELSSGLKSLDEPLFAARIELNLGNVLLLQDRMKESRVHLEKALSAFEERDRKSVV